MPGERSGLPVSRPYAVVWIAFNTLWVFAVGRVVGGFIITIFRDARSELWDKLIVAVFLPPIGLLAIVAAGVFTMLWLIRLERAMRRRRGDA